MVPPLPANTAVVTLVLFADSWHEPSAPLTEPSVLVPPVLSNTAEDSVDGTFPVVQSAAKSDAPIAICPHVLVAPAVITPSG